MPQKHTIAAGDTLESICKQYGLATVERLIAANATLKESAFLVAGKQLDIPDKKPPTYDCVTGRKNTLVVPSLKAFLHVKLDTESEPPPPPIVHGEEENESEDEERDTGSASSSRSSNRDEEESSESDSEESKDGRSSRPRQFGNKRYKGKAGEKEFEGRTTEDGAIHQEVPVGTQKVEVSVWPLEGDDESKVDYTFELGAIPAGNDVKGAQVRLNNLGYGVGEPNGSLSDETKAAIAAFQEDVMGVEPTGNLDAATGAALENAHDGGAA